jgi:hypothetical protein
MERASPTPAHLECMLSSRATSGYRGVGVFNKHSESARYGAYVIRDGKNKHLGAYPTAEEAAERVLEEDSLGVGVNGRNRKRAAPPTDAPYSRAKASRGAEESAVAEAISDAPTDDAPADTAAVVTVECAVPEHATGEALHWLSPAGQWVEAAIPPGASAQHRIA